MLPLFSRALFIGLLHLSAVALHASDWPHEYTPVATPENSLPKWQLSTKAKENISITDGKLKVTSQADKPLIYTIGTYEGGKEFGDGAAAWDASSGHATVEIRLKCESDNAEAEIFRLSLSDGEKNWSVIFKQHAISIPRVSKVVDVDMSQAETYRLAVKGGKLQVSSSGKGILYTDIAGIPFNKLPKRNRMLFGTTGEPGASGAIGWEVEFIRWTNQDGAPAQP